MAGELGKRKLANSVCCFSGRKAVPAVPARQLIAVIEDAIAQSGASAVLTSAIRTHPRKFAITDSSQSPLIWVYAWTLTPGGRPQLRNEYRIQMTGVDSPLLLNPSGPTILIGYEPNLRMFAGFDIQLHRTFTAGSPSVQVNIQSLREALQHGLAFHRKENNETTVAIRPDHLLTYAYNSEGLHKHAQNLRTLRALVTASSRQPITEEDLARLSKERRRLVQTVRRASRAANFREQVLNAYGHRCAITRMQLRLVEACHILPVAAPNSPDHVTNGIALSPTYHRAFDTGLIYLDHDYTMRMTPQKKTELETLRLTGGLADFETSLCRIHLPPDQAQWPHTTLIRRANKFRGIE